jgi:hypothetical protein
LAPSFVVLSAAGSVTVVQTTEDFSMSNKLASYFIAGALVSALALASPALARGGGGMGGGMGMGGGHGMGGGMGMHSMGRVGAVPMGAISFGAMPMSRAAFAPRAAIAPRAAFAPRFSRAAFVHNRFFHRRFNRFAFVGGPFFYAGYDDCWRQVWTQFGLQWVNICGYDYNYGY